MNFVRCIEFLLDVRYANCKISTGKFCFFFNSRHDRNNAKNSNNPKQKWADHLRQVGTLAHGQMENCGQSLLVSVTDITGDKVAQSWYDENESYDYNNPGWNQHCTNFTQMIWKTTSRVGVGYARRPGGMLYIVAHYFPPGNVGSFRHNVLPPTMIGSALVKSDRPVLPIPTSGRVPPPPPPPPDVPPPPPPDYKNSGNFIRRAMLEATVRSI